MRTHCSAYSVAVEGERKGESILEGKTKEKRGKEHRGNKTVKLRQRQTFRRQQIQVLHLS